MSNNWQTIEDLFHAALPLNKERRAEYLAEACAGDEPLRREVETLLSAFEARSDFMEQPTFSLGLRVMSYESRNELPAGQPIGSYKVLRKLGEGGMGKVYLATDTRLGRNVALKFLSGAIADDQWAKRQLIKEAQAVAMLDHPNICSIHGFEEVDGYSFIVMQYVEGETLDALLRAKRLKLEQKLDLASQIAAALSEAHSHGIIHRDVKPQNIMVTASGQIKMLDFGLAKLIQQKHSLLEEGQQLSQTSKLGLIPGTVAYMSPEQLRGERLDYRSDIFSFGTLLYEVLSGSNPHERPSKAETISAVLNQQAPPLRRSAPEVPRELDRIVTKCLEKNKEHRYQSVSEMRYDLNNLQTSANGATPWFQYFSLRIATMLVVLLLVIAVSTFVYLRLTRTPIIAVLPIVNDSGDTSVEYLADGLTESLISKLSRLSKLRVKALTSVSGYKGKNIAPEVIGHNLNADAVLISTLTRQGEALVLQTRLVDTDSGTEDWSHRYEVKMTEILALQEDISANIASHLESRFEGEDKRLLAHKGTENPEAFREYMLGRHYWRIRDKENIETAIKHFNAAIAIDPVYAKAYAGLADCYVLLNIVSYGHMDTKEAMTKAEAAANQALDIDELLPDAHTSLGFVNMKYRWDWQAAEREFKRAIEINQDYAPAHYGYSNLLAITGREREAISEGEIAKDLDPFSPATLTNYCRAFYYAQEYDRAISCFDKLISERPDYKMAQYARGFAYLRKGMNAEATATFEKLYEMDRPLAGAALGYAYGITGRKGDALRVLSEMQGLSNNMSIPPQEFALIYLGIGDLDNAFIFLQKSAAEHYSPFPYLAVDPAFENLRSDQRFIDLVRQLNLPKASASN